MKEAVVTVRDVIGLLRMVIAPPAAMPDLKVSYKLWYENLPEEMKA